MTRQYSHFTVAVSSEELDEFVQKLQEIKDYFGTESTSTVIQKMVNEWAEIHWKAQTYEQLRDIILGYEAYHKSEKGGVNVEREGRSVC